jgi:hypothetical protein
VAHCTIGLLLSAITALPAAAGANTGRDDPALVTEWNAIAVSTLAGDASKSIPESALYLGFVHAAVHDAAVGIHRRYEPYRYQHNAPRGSSAPAAVTTAAYQILATYSPSAKAALDARYAESLAGIPDSRAKTDGIMYGTRVADNHRHPLPHRGHRRLEHSQWLVRWTLHHYFQPVD